MNREKQMEQAERTVNLWYAVLSRACQDAINRNQDKSSQNIRQDAIDYFISTEMSQGSFAWICRHLDLEETSAREIILKRISKSERTSEAVPRRSEASE